MFGPASLRERLGELARSRRADLLRPAEGVALETLAERDVPIVGGAAIHPPRTSTGSIEPARRERPATGVEAFLPGGEWRDEGSAVYVHERLRSDIERRRSHWGALGEPPEREIDLLALREAGIGAALFLDLETGGLASSPVFLAGTMHWNGSDFVLRQYFARHYGEEAGLLRALQQQARGFQFVVTFNGKSYDAPFLMSRALIHGVALVLPPRHVDLLHPSRRRWKGIFRDCRLQTLERGVCRRHRSGDVPSDEVPALYHDFVRHGDPYRLIPVFHHNLLDVITMAEILHALCTRPPPERSGWEFDLEPTADWLF